MRGFEHNVCFFFNDGTKIPIVDQIITARKAIYNLFVSRIYHRPNSVFKSKYINFTILLLVFSGKDTRMADYFIETHRDIHMRKALLSQFLLKNSTVWPSTKKFAK